MEPFAHRAKRRFGQNFLRDQQAIDSVINAIAPESSESFVEIGPGYGALTEALVTHAQRVELVEIDRELSQMLQERYAYHPGVSVHCADILRFDLARIAPEGSKFRVVGNVPYNISTPILFRLLEFASCIQDMHLMLQREVAQRLVASPGGGDYGRLSVMAQYRCQMMRFFDVPPQAFHPVPKVFSSLVRLVPIQAGPKACRDKDLRTIVTRCFMHRRKTIRNGLKGYLDESEISQCHVEPERRPQTLTLADFIALADVFSAKRVTHRNCE